MADNYIVEANQLNNLADGVRKVIGITDSKNI